MMPFKTIDVYFGGSFDPPHRGHFEIIQSLLKDSWVRKIHFVPTGVNPLKAVPELQWKNQKRKVIDAFLQDLLDTQKELDAYKAKFVVHWDEFESNEPSYTVDTLKKLKAREADRSWALALGSDLLQDLAKFKSIESLLCELHSVWVFPRDGRVDFDDLPHPLRALTSFRHMTSPVVSVSSTKLRELLQSPKKNEQSLASLLTPRVSEMVLSKE